MYPPADHNGRKDIELIPNQTIFVVRLQHRRRRYAEDPTAWTLPEFMAKKRIVKNALARGKCKRSAKITNGTFFSRFFISFRFYFLDLFNMAFDRLASYLDMMTWCCCMECLRPTLDSSHCCEIYESKVCIWRYNLC